MSEGLVSVRPDIANMMRLKVRLSENPSATELERMREQIYSRMADTTKGVVLDFQEVGRTSLDALSVLNTARNFAASERKRLILYKITPEFGDLLSQYENVFQFDVHGFSRPVPKPMVTNRPKSRFSPEAWRRIKNIGIAVSVLFPLVLVVEYFLVYQAGGNETVVVKKSFEEGKEPFVVKGNVDVVSRGIKTPAKDAVVIAMPLHPDGTPVSVEAWTTVTDSFGDYRLPLPLDSYQSHLDVDVIVTAPTVTKPGGDEDEGFFPTHRFRYSIRSGQPLDVDATFVLQD